MRRNLFKIKTGPEVPGLFQRMRPKGRYRDAVSGQK